MIIRTLFYSALFAVLVGCGSSRDDTDLVSGSNGSVAISGVALVGETLTASITDEDGVTAGSETYQWFASGDQIDGAASSTYTLTAEEDGDLITVVVRYTDSQGLRETNESSSTAEVAGAFSLGATFIHGLVDGATCSIFAVDAAGVASTTAAASGTTTNGVVDFGGLVPIDGTGLIQCTGGTYTDEATGLELDAPDTRAVVTVDGDTSFTVSPLTEIAAQRAEAAGDLNTAVTTHNAAVAVLFGLSGDITETVPTDISTTAVADDDPGRYATALALISQLDANDVATSTAEIIANLASDLADGSLSESTLNSIGTARTSLASSAFADNLDNNVLLIVESALSSPPEAATFEGLSATIPNDQETALTGSVTVSDSNFGEDRIVVQTDVATTYGTFSIAEDGSWSYTLNTQDSTVAALEVGASVNDSILIESADGTPANLVIRVTALTQVAEITNTINGDTGELRLNLDQHQLEGKLTFSFLKTEALADDGNQKDAYVTLYGSSGSSSESLVDLRIQGEAAEDDGSTRDPRFLVRNTDSSAYTAGTITAPFTPNEWYEVEITWDVNQAGQELTISINGELLGGGAFQTAAFVDNDCGAEYRTTCFAEGIERIQWRFGDNGTVIPFGAYYVDNIVIYSDAAGTTVAFEDNFEANTEGNLLNVLPYAADSVDAEVGVFDAGSSDEVEPTPAVFFNLTGSMDADQSEVLMGTINVIDPDQGENLLVGQADIQTTYGSFSLLPAGMWEYGLDTTNETIAALLRGEFETDTVTVTSADGTTAELVITILGVIELAPTGGLGNPGNQYANIVDVAGTSADAIDDAGGTQAVAVIAADDTGELRIDLGSDNKIVTGRMTVQIYKEAESNTSTDAFILLGGVDTGTGESIFDLRLDQSGNHFDVRNGSTGLGTYNTETVHEIEISWDASGADDATAPIVSFSVDGVPLVTDEPSGTTNLTEAKDGVRYIQFRVADNDDISRGDFRVDELVVYETISGVESEKFSDDFEAYTPGESLDSNADDAGAFTLAQTPSALIPTQYNNNSFSVTVDTEE